MKNIDKIEKPKTKWAIVRIPDKTLQKVKQEVRDRSAKEKRDVLQDEVLNDLIIKGLAV